MKAPDESAAGFAQVWRDELDEIEHTREMRTGQFVQFVGTEPRERAGHARLVGLALSGGGIRSATFNLGILQGLARRAILKKMDYLSTVSGGGYIGSWLAAWIKRQGFERVDSQLRERSSDPQSPSLEPISFLRDYSNYLTPQKGFFSADTWTMLMIWWRNTFLNQIILISFLGFLLLLPRLLKLGLDSLWQIRWLALPLAALFYLAAAVMIGKHLGAIDRSGEPPRRPRLWRKQAGVQWFIVAPLMAGAWLASAVLWAYLRNLRELPQNPGPNPGGQMWAAAIGAAAALFALLTIVVFVSRFRSALLLRIVICAGCAAVASLLFYGLERLYWNWAADAGPHAWHVAVWGAPLLLAILTLVSVLQIGWAGRHMPDDHREWWSRLGAWVALYGLAASFLAVTAIYGPLLMARFWGWASGYAAKTVTVGWLVTTVSSILAGKSGITGSKPGEKASGPASMELLATAGSYVSVVGLLLILSVGLHVGLVWTQCHLVPGTGGLAAAEPASQQQTFSQVELTGKSGAPLGAEVKIVAGVNGTVTCPACGKSKAGSKPLCSLLDRLSAAGLDANHWALMSAPQPGILWLFAGVLLLVLAVFTLTVDVNEFSLHHFYRNRLIRCYLGASHPNRHPNLFTGFDRTDDLPLAEFKHDAESLPYQGPYPIVNTTFNFNHGARLAWQERQGASFVFTPKYSGYETFGVAPKIGPASGCLADEGYRPTERYAQSGGISIGTAMGISGAAASPNMGYHTSAAIAFLLTVFDVRLGWWLGNPRHPRTWPKGGPRIGLMYLLAELFGTTSADSRYIYLSDGGHFENLGIYELARRHCAVIVACDAEQDGDFTFGGLGNAIRKCRTDLGIRIEIDVNEIRTRDSAGLSKAHYAVGTIVYPELGYPAGKLIYIKSSLAVDKEPTDVLEYRSRESSFPHQSTADQFFDESQFESYRALGEHIVDSVATELAWI